MGIHGAILKESSYVSWTQSWGELALSRVPMSPHPVLVRLTPGNENIAKIGSWGRYSRNGAVPDVPGKGGTQWRGCSPPSLAMGLTELRNQILGLPPCLCHTGLRARDLPVPQQVGTSPGNSLSGCLVQRLSEPLAGWPLSVNQSEAPT